MACPECGDPDSRNLCEECKTAITIIRSNTSELLTGQPYNDPYPPFADNTDHNYYEDDGPVQYPPFADNTDHNYYEDDGPYPPFADNTDHN